MTAIPNEDAAVEAALKLCPFCGNAPVVRRSMQEYPAEGEHPAGEYEAWVTIACDTCGIEIGGEYRSEAIAAWNRRSAYPIIAGEGVRNDKRAAIANIVIDAVKHVRQRPAGLRGPYVFNDEELDRLIALAAPPPQPEVAGLVEAARSEERGKALNMFAEVCHEANIKWWRNPETGEPIERNKGELLCLIHSEISEAMEGERKNLPDDKLPHRRMAEVELVDALIRIFDYAGAFGYDLSGAFVEKMDFNASREDHTHEARLRAGGKKW